MKKGKTMEKRITILLILLLVVIAAIIILAWFDLVDWSSKVTVAQILEILTLIILVFITAMYALSASEQADTSMKMAEAMEQQRLDEARPYLLIRLKDKSVPVEPTLGHPANFTVMILNAGKGPAIDLQAAVWYPNRNPFLATEVYLVSDKEWEAVISGYCPVGEQPEKGKEGWLAELSELVNRPQPGVVAVTYQDIHRRTYVSYLCLQSPVNDASIAYEGEHNILELKKND